MPVEGAGQGSITGATRKVLTRSREETRLQVLERAMETHSDQFCRGVSSWKERDKMTTAFLLANPGPTTGISSPFFAEALGTLLCLPSRACSDRVGERVGTGRVDAHGERVILENLPGAHWTERHNIMAQEVAAVCAYERVVAEREPFGLFGHLVPQQALSALQRNQVSQVLRPDLRLEIPQGRTRPPDGGGGRQQCNTAKPAPAPTKYCGPVIAEVKVISKGVKAHYKAGSVGSRAVESRAAQIPGEYRRKVAKMDQAILGREGEGPCAKRLGQFPLMKLVWGAFGEGSEDVHTLVAVLAESRVRTLALRGEPPAPNQLGLEVTLIRRRLSAAAIRAANGVLLARMSQVGEGSGMAGRRREVQRKEEMAMCHQKEADWAVKVTGQELVRRGRFWRG